MRHTSGPWESKQWSFCDNFTIYANNDGEHIAYVDEKANADLISAAPDMLEALQGLSSIDFGAKGWGKKAETFAILARKAIAKAKGRTEMDLPKLEERLSYKTGETLAEDMKSEHPNLSYVELLREAQKIHTGASKEFWYGFEDGFHGAA